MMYPLGTVMFHIHLLYLGKLFGKFGLAKKPLNPVRMSPEAQAMGKSNSLMRT